MMWVQVTIAAHDDDFVIPTVRPLSRANSRHSILMSAGHDAQHSRTQGHSARFMQKSSSKKTSFNLGSLAAELGDAAEHAQSDAQQTDAASELSQSPAKLQQQSTDFASANASPADAVVLGSGDHPHLISSQQQILTQVSLPDQAMARQTSALDAMSQDYVSMLRQSSLAQKMGATKVSGSGSKTSPSKTAQKAVKPVRQMQDWVGVNSRKQLHK